ncbi:MAG TPA: hypothetical protein VGD07_11485 [Methylomirabilota bacterium]|jgi:hypothetical protein
MSVGRGRRTAITLLLGLLAGAVLLALAPAAPGAVRVAGVSLLWWYAAVAAPLAATVIAVVALLRDGP